MTRTDRARVWLAPLALIRIWSFPLGLTIVVAAATALSTGAVRFLLATTLAVTLTHPSWWHGIGSDLAATGAWRLTSAKHWRSYCDTAKLVDGDRYPTATTRVGPYAHPWRTIVAHLLRGNRREAFARQWITHDIKLLEHQVGEKWRTILEETGRQFYDYPAAVVRPNGNRWLLRITSERLPYVVAVTDDDQYTDDEIEEIAS